MCFLNLDDFDLLRSMVSPVGQGIRADDFDLHGASKFIFALIIAGLEWVFRKAI